MARCWVHLPRSVMGCPAGLRPTPWLLGSWVPRKAPWGALGVRTKRAVAMAPSAATLMWTLMVTVGTLTLNPTATSQWDQPAAARPRLEAGTPVHRT